MSLQPTGFVRGIEGCRRKMKLMYYLHGRKDTMGVLQELEYYVGDMNKADKNGLVL